MINIDDRSLTPASRRRRQAARQRPIRDTPNGARGRVTDAAYRTWTPEEGGEREPPDQEEEASLSDPPGGSRRRPRRLVPRTRYFPRYIKMTGQIMDKRPEQLKRMRECQLSMERQLKESPLKGGFYRTNRGTHSPFHFNRRRGFTVL